MKPIKTIQFICWILLLLLPVQSKSEEALNRFENINVSEKFQPDTISIDRSQLEFFSDYLDILKNVDPFPKKLRVTSKRTKIHFKNI